MTPELARLQEALAGGGAELVLVGGAVRDELLGRPHADWDLATSLLPEEVMARAKRAGLKALPTGLQHGTVTVLVDALPFEITTYRSEGDYADGRRPDSVKLGVTLEEDLSRRDFSINAMAMRLEGGEVIDPFGGRRDLEARLIRAVGDPLERFREDGLRPLRACRFASQLGFGIEAATQTAIPARLHIAKLVAVERVFVELTKLLCGAEPGRGLQVLADTGLLDLWTPELRPMIGCGQNRHHKYPVWEHVLEVVRLAPAEPALRWAALLHDAGKPRTRTTDEHREVHFYGHEEHSLRIAEALLTRLRSSKELMQEVLALVRHHGTHPTDEWSDAACRRFLRKLEEDKLSLARWGAFRIADQLGKGFGDEPYRSENAKVLARLQALADARPPLHAKALALDGRELMALAQRKGGPWLGELQAHLLDRVIEDPSLNTPEELSRLVGEFLKLG